jgi:hypothetical protein
MSRSVGYQSLPKLPFTAEVGESDAHEIEAGQRDKAIRIIREWLTEIKPQVLKISDPYFGPSDLELLKIVLEAQPTCRVEILAGEKKQHELGLTLPYDSAYRDHWKEICQHDPPDTHIVIAGLTSNTESPVHERYLISEPHGLELGTSFGGLGRSKVSKISRLSRARAISQGNTLDVVSQQSGKGPTR